MKYQAPYGVSNPDAPYINGDPTIGRQGSIPPAAAFEYPMRELVNVISKSKIVASDDDLMQVAKGIRSQAMNYVEDTGSANSLSVALDPPLGAYTLGLLIRVRIRTTNTGGATIDAGAGRVPVKKMNGGGTAAGDLPAGGIADLVYDGSGFQLVNFGGSGGTGTGDQFLIKIPYTVDSSATPNIIIGNFSPAITSLVAGDPLLVKIANTCTGSSVIRVNGLPDKPIRANGGGATAGLLQGDLQAGDVVLFLYDGTNFWIQPNPLISADTTINVPSQFSTVENALLAIRRKTIAQNARVTVLIGISVIAPFTISHANADRITIRGTLKIPGNLTGPNFAQSGNSAAARAQDSANNIAMLRNRFGTEVQVVPTGPSGSSFSAGIENVGPGNPTVQDILVTGPNYWSGEGIGRWVGATLGGGRYLTCVNVSTWGLDIGFYGSGTLIASYCFASGCFRNGAHVTSLGLFGLSYSGFFGGSLGGITCNQNSWLGTAWCWSNYNSNHGAMATDNSQLTYHSSQAQGNGAVDITAGPLSLTVILNSAAGGGYGTVSPAPGYMSNYGALVIEG
jgi:hypothetical protein